jgi:glycogen(starch) synthase
VRILVRGPFLPTVGGIEMQLARVLPVLQARGYEIAVATDLSSFEAAPSQEEYGGISVHRFPFVAALESKDLARIVDVSRGLERLKREFAPELIHLHGVLASSLFDVLTMHADQAPLLLTLHQEVSPSQIERGTVTERLLRRADWVTAVSSVVLDQARRIAPEITGRSQLVYNGVREPARPPKPLRTDPPRLLCQGRLIRGKGFDIALHAFQKIAAQVPATRLTVIGDGVERQALERQAAEMSLYAAVDFRGWLPRQLVSEAMDAASVVLIPSRREGLCLVAIEAALMKRPVIATRTGGLPEVVVDGETGILIEREDSDALTAAITFLLDHPERAREMGKAARRHVLERFSWDRYVDSCDALYRKLIAGATARSSHAAGA